MIQISTWFVIAGVLGLLLFSAEVILRELHSRPAQRVPRRWSRIIAGIKWFLFFLFSLSCVFVFPPHFGIFLFAMTIAVFIHTIVRRRAEDAQLLDSLAQCVVIGGASAPEAFDKFAGKRTNSISRRCRDFAAQLRSGVSPSQAAKKSRIPLSVNALLQLEDGQRREQKSTVSRSPSFISTLSWSAWPMGGQVMYLCVLIFLIATLPLASSFFIKDFLYQMFDEFGIQRPVIFGSLVNQESPLWHVGILLFSALVLWLLLVAISAATHFNFLIRMTPWFGDWFRTRGRCQALRGFASGLDSGRTPIDSAESLVRLSRSAWMRNRGRAVVKALQSGTVVSKSLLRSGLVNYAESLWIQSAEATGNLADAMLGIADAAQRKFELKWRVRLAWMIPCALMVLGVYVSVYAYFLIGFLAQLIEGLS